MIRKAEAGITLVEVLIAAAIAGVVILGATSLMDRGARQSVELGIRVDRAASSALFRHQFILNTDRLMVSQRHQNLPIPKDCGGVPRPCVRRWEEGRGVFFDQAPVTLPDAIQFFRDERGSIELMSSMVGDQVARAQGSVPLTDVETYGDYYATWPLVDDTSPRLVVFRVGKSARYLELVSTGAGGASVWSSTQTEDPVTWLGNLLWVFVAEDPQLTIFPWVSQALSVGPTQLRFTTQGTGAPSGFVAFGGSLPSGLPVGPTWRYQWWGQVDSHFALPSEVSLTVLPGAPPPAAQPPPVASVAELDARNTATHLGAAAGGKERQKLLASPIEAVAYYLEPAALPGVCAQACTAGKLPPAGCPRSCRGFRLVEEVFHANPARRAKRIVQELTDGPVVFARRLGSQELKIFELGG